MYCGLTIVGTVGNGHHHSRGNLGICPEMLNAVVVDDSAGVNLAKILLSDNVAGNTLEQKELHPVSNLLGRVDGEVLNGLQPALLRLGLGGNKVNNRALAGHRVGETAALTLDIDVVAVAGRLVVEGGRVSVALLAALEVVMDRLALDGGCLGIVVGDDLVALAREVDGRVLAVQKRTERNVPRPQPGVALDETAGEVRDEEDVGDGKHAEEDTEDNTAGLASTHLLKRLAVWQLIDNEQSQDTGSKGKVEGNKAETPLERVLPLVDTKLDSQEEDGSKGGRDEGSNDPGGSNLGDGTLLPAPAKRRLGSNTGTSEGSDDCLGGRDGHTRNGGDGEESSGANLGAAHGEHESGRRGLKGIEREDTALDGTCDTRAQGDGTQELGTRGEDTGLPHLQGPGSHRSGV